MRKHAVSHITVDGVSTGKRIKTCKHSYSYAVKIEIFDAD